jgi:hypothetical protein
MRKRILLDLNKLPPDKWIYLPNGTKVHPEELKRMFKPGEVGYRKKELGFLIDEYGTIYYEAIGKDRDYHTVHIPSSSSSYPGIISSHSHPLMKNKYVGMHSGNAAQSLDDFFTKSKEERMFTREPYRNNIKCGVITSATKNLLERDRKNMNKLQDYCYDKGIEQLDKFGLKNATYNSRKNLRDLKLHADSFKKTNFDAARNSKLLTNYYHINVEKGKQPGQVYITKIRSTEEPEEPDYSVAKSLRKKKRNKKPTKLKRCRCKPTKSKKK